MQCVLREERAEGPPPGDGAEKPGWGPRWRVDYLGVFARQAKSMGVRTVGVGLGKAAGRVMGSKRGVYSQEKWLWILASPFNM